MFLPQVDWRKGTNERRSQAPAVHAMSLAGR
jgi:hypothetical protein